MFLRSILQSWLQNAAKAKVRETLAEAARGQSSPAEPGPAADEPRSCDLGVVFALGIESGCLEDLLEGAVTIRGHGFTAREGGLKGCHTVLMLSGAGQAKAAAAAERLIEGHRPRRVVSAGFAGGLCPRLKRNDILIADRLLNTDGGEIQLEWPAGLPEGLTGQGVHRGPLLTADRVVRLPSEKRSLFERYGALAVDMETFAVAEVCARRGTPFASIRVINDAADEALPRDVERLLSQKTQAARLGAAFGAVLNRPSSAKDLYLLRENALVASSRLARFLADIVGALTM